MLYGEIIALCSQIQTKHINTLCGLNLELLNVKLLVLKVTTGLWTITGGPYFMSSFTPCLTPLANLQHLLVYALSFSVWRPLAGRALGGCRALRNSWHRIQQSGCPLTANFVNRRAPAVQPTDKSLDHVCLFACLPLSVSFLPTNAWKLQGSNRKAEAIRNDTPNPT
jgi:hypothetical protein